MNNYRYIRFVVAEKGENRWEANGIFSYANLYLTHKASRRDANKIFNWFNDNVTCPPFRFSLQERDWDKNCIAWWRTTAKEPIAKCQPLIDLLRSNGYRVCTIRTNYPGIIVWRDKVQVVARMPKSRGYLMGGGKAA